MVVLKVTYKPYKNNKGVEYNNTYYRIFTGYHYDQFNLKVSKNYFYLKRGNKKIGRDSIIFNCNTYTNCYSRCSGLCNINCYNKKYEAVGSFFNKNNKNLLYKIKAANGFLDAYYAYNKNDSRAYYKIINGLLFLIRRFNIKSIRINEAGDLLNAKMLYFLKYISMLINSCLKERVRFYTYTKNFNIDLYTLKRCIDRYFNINLSMVKYEGFNGFITVGAKMFKNIKEDKNIKKCKNNCKICGYCKINSNITIYCKKH